MSTMMGFGGVAAAADAPSIRVLRGTLVEELKLDRFPYSIGRKPENALVIADPSVSREHAQIIREGNQFVFLDLGSKHGSKVNGNKADRVVLKPNDRIDLGLAQVHVIFSPQTAEGESVIQRLSSWQEHSTYSDLEHLREFLDAARRLNLASAVSEVLTILVDFSLRVTKAERAFFFRCNPGGEITLAYGRDSKGTILTDANTVSHSVLKDALKSGSDFLITDTQQESNWSARESIVAHNLRSILCIPLRRKVGSRDETLWGLLYLDSHYRTKGLTNISHDIVRALANDAAALIEHAYLAEAEEMARRERQEMGIAAEIQKQLLSVSNPDCKFATFKARTIPCKSVGGDFYDVVTAGDSMYFVFADVSGKGISAALLASVLQGVAFSHFVQQRPVVEMVHSANRLLCNKQLLGKYATLLAGQLRNDGELTIVNCGHLPPLRIEGDVVSTVQTSSLPVGLFPEAQYEEFKTRLIPNSRLLVFSDGITEAEDPDGEFYGDDRLNEVAAKGVEAVLESVVSFAQGQALNDDCSLLEVQYLG
ncbi:MAG TPA: SpoIIE family protein phosphatase [Candidatus Koribacter sp.]